jgi:hypothetical protein
VIKLARYHPNHLHATLQRISPRWLALVDFPALPNLILDILRMPFGDMM